MNAPALTEWVEYADDRPATPEQLHEIEQFYYREARLLDRHRARQWLDTMVDRDIFYWLPITEERFRRDRRPAPTPQDPAIYADDYSDLDHRIQRLETGLVWMEDPPARLRHLLTNIEAYQTPQEGLFLAFSNFHIYRNRRQRDESNLVGGREDLLRRDDDGRLRLYRRKITLDQRVVLDKNLYFFF